jgi:hypothetical protein
MPKKYNRGVNGGGLSFSTKQKSNTESLVSKMANEQKDIFRALQIIQKKRDNETISSEDEEFYNSYLEKILVNFPHGLGKTTNISEAFISSPDTERKYNLFRDKLLDYLNKTFMSELRTGTSKLSPTEKRCLTEPVRTRLLSDYAKELEQKQKYQEQQKQKEEAREQLRRQARIQAVASPLVTGTNNADLIEKLRQERMERDKINIMKSEYDNTISKLGYQKRRISIPSFETWKSISLERDQKGLPEKSLNDWLFESQTNTYRQRHLSPASKTIRRLSKPSSHNKTAKIRRTVTPAGKGTKQSGKRSIKRSINRVKYGKRK